MSDCGYAVLVTVNVEDPGSEGAMWEGPFDERPGDEPHQHPIARAWALWEGIKDDWPTHRAAVIANDRAKAMAAAYRVSAMLGTPYQDALREQVAGRGLGMGEQGLAPLRGSQQDLCANCGQRPGTVQWGDALAFTHGGIRMWCELCATRAQLAHAIERAALIPVMKARIAELEASSPVPSEEQP